MAWTDGAYAVTPAGKRSRAGQAVWHHDTALLLDVEWLTGQAGLFSFETRSWLGLGSGATWFAGNILGGWGGGKSTQ